MNESGPEGPRSVLVFGSTGLVGQAVVKHLLQESPDVHIVAPVRRPDARWADTPRVDTPIVDFADLGAVLHGLCARQVFICLGTTMKTAGSREAFRQVDLHAVVAAARVASDIGAKDAFLVSSVGAGSSARSFYLRVKAESEQALATLPFRSLHVFRPSVLTGQRADSRPSERMGIAIGRALAPFMVGAARRYRPIAACVVARAMVMAARDPGTGMRVHESEVIARTDH